MCNIQRCHKAIMTRPILFSLVLMILAMTVAGRFAGHYDDLTEEGQPGWIERQIEQAKDEIRERESLRGMKSNQVDEAFDEYLNDDLTEEGQPGWMKKLIEKEMAKNGKREYIASIRENKLRQREQFPDTGRSARLVEDESPYFVSDEATANDNSEDTSFPEEAVTKLKSSLSVAGDKAKGALNGIAKIREKWATYSVADRAVLIETMKSSTTDFEAMFTAKDDPVGAIQGAMSVISNFATLAGPKGQLISESVAFAAGILSLFGGGEEKSVGEVVREQMDEALNQFYHQDLKNEAAGVTTTFDITAAYVEHLAQDGQQLTVDQMASLERNAPLYLGLTFMGKLASVIEGITQKNPGGDEAKKCLEYIELYTKMAVLKDTILTQVASVYPDELEPNKKSLLNAMASLRTTQKGVFKFLFEGNAASNILPYYDPDSYPVTDSYLIKVLKVPNYDRSWAGLRCLTPNRGGEKLAITFSSVPGYLTTGRNNPYITVIKAKYCNWKLIPHGKSLFTVRNVFDCKDDKKPTCGRYLSFSGLSWPDKHESRLDLQEAPRLWEIVGNNQKRIRTKYGCGGEGDSKWCNRQIQPREEFDKVTFGMTSSNVGWVWHITKEPMIKV